MRSNGNYLRMLIEVFTCIIVIIIIIIISVLEFLQHIVD